MFKRKVVWAVGLYVGLGMVLVGSLNAQESWTQWRGPQRNGLVQDVHWPELLGKKQLSPAWKVRLGPSYSAPLVKAGVVYTTETRDRKFEVASAFELKTGRKLWEAKWPGALSVPFFAKANGDWIRGTPALHDGRLFVGGMRDVLTCLDAKTGKVVWRKDFVAELKTPLPKFGYVSSPLVDGQHVYVQAGGGVVKLKASTGEVVWWVLRDGGGMNGSAFSSPVIETLHGERQLVVQTRGVLAGVALDSGDTLWKKTIPAFRGMNIITPCKYKSGFFVSTYGGGTSYFEVDKKEGRYQVVEKWHKTTQGYMSTPVIVGRFAFTHLRNQRVTCFDVETGEQSWTSTPFGKYWSMVSDGHHILALDADGMLYLVEANAKEMKIIDRSRVSESPTWAHLTTVDGHLLVRSLNELICLNWQTGSEADSSEEGD